ncbi:hypothetical protein Tco_0154447 [Tanacetum coccineum]
MENPEQAFVDYASSRTDEAGGKWYTFKPEQNNLGDAYNPSWKSYPNLRWRQPQNSQNNFSNPPNPDFKQQQGEMTNKIDTVLKAINDRIMGAPPEESEEEVEEEKGDPGNVNTNPPSPPDPSTSFVTEKYNDSFKEELEEDESAVAGELEPREDPEGIRGLSNFTGRNKGMHVFVGNFTYISDFIIDEDNSSIIDPRLSQVVLGRPFVEASNMTHDLSLGVVKFINRTNEVAYKMPHKIEQYNLLSNLEKEHTKSIYLRNEEDKRRGVEYVMNKILGFYKECLELGPKYLIGHEDEGGVTLYLMRRSLGVFRSFIGQLLDDDLASYRMFLLLY